MAIVSVIQVDEQGGDWTLNPDGLPIRKYSRTFKVLTDALTDDTYIVLSAAGIPALGDAFSVNDTGAICNNKSAKQTKSKPTLWVVNVSYASDVPTVSELPWLREVKWSLDTKTADEPVTEDVRGEDYPILNSAGDPPLPPVTVPKSHLVWRAEWAKLASDFDASVYRTFKDKTNSEEIEVDGITYPQYSLKVTQLSKNEDSLEGQDYVTLTATLEENIVEEWDFETDPENPTVTYVGGWRPSYILDQGFNAFDPDTGEVRPVLDNRGNPKQTPTLLADGGTVLPADDPPHYIEDGDGNEGIPLVEKADLNQLFE